MDILQTFLQNLLSPAILFFALGILAGFLKSDLNVPESISRYLSIYLMMAIGFKGGAALAETEWASATLLPVMAAGVAMSFIMPFAGFGLLKATTRLDAPTLAAIAGHYGSVSIVTIVTAASFLQQSAIAYEGYIVAVLALMEAPAILSALYIAHRAAPETITAGKQATPKLAVKRRGFPSNSTRKRSVALRSSSANGAHATFASRITRGCVRRSSIASLPINSLNGG